MKVTPLAEADLADVTRLLEESGLPISDLAQAKPMFLGVRSGELVGVVGMETRGRYGLLRSLAVRKEARGQGLGTTLADAVERWAASHGIEEVYLLTTTAERFFSGRGYEVQAREQVPEEIRTTTEFTSACPASASVMHRAVH